MCDRPRLVLPFLLEEVTAGQVRRLSWLNPMDQSVTPAPEVWSIGAGKVSTALAKGRAAHLVGLMTYLGDTGGGCLIIKISETGQGQILDDTLVVPGTVTPVRVPLIDRNGIVVTCVADSLGDGGYLCLLVEIDGEC